MKTIQHSSFRREWWTAYARIQNAEDFLRCGWKPTDVLKETNHGEWSVLMERPACECGKVPNPQHSNRRGKT